MKIVNRIFNSVEELECLVINAATQYESNGFVEDEAGVEISDADYDTLFRELKILKPDSQAFKGTSPSIFVPKGSTLVHNPPMISINKSDGSLDQKTQILNKWIDDSSKRIDKPIEVVQSYKHDGVALRCNYVKGKLVSAGLRPRDGINGSDVTRHMKYIKGVPSKLKLPLTLSLNGEIECWDEDFKQVNAERDSIGEDLYKNPRNYTAGCMNRDNPEENKNARLRICFYSISGFDEWENYYRTEIERAIWANSSNGLSLKENETRGFFVQVRKHEFKHLEMMEVYSKKLPYYTDGIILKVNDLSDQDELGHTGDDAINPLRGALAWKFQEETVEATVSSIEWNASRTGRIVPTAIFDEPFFLADTENTRATCNNYGWMESQGLGPGAKVRCKKGGKIIPNIMEIISPVDIVGEPSHCPTCAEKLEIHISTTGNKDLVCRNKECGSKKIKSWMFYIQKIGGKGLGISAMEKILKTGKVKNLSDLYNLEIEDLLKVGFKDRQSVLVLATIFMIKPEDDSLKLLEKINKQKTKTFSIDAWKFFASLGIPGSGDTAGKILFSKFKDINKIKLATVEELSSIDGIGPITALAVHDYFEQNFNEIVKLLGRFTLELPKDGVLSGKNFVLTGSFSNGKSYFENLIEENGGNIQSSVGKTTSFLVQQFGKNDGSPSEKEIKANKLGVKVISIAELEKMI